MLSTPSIGGKVADLWTQVEQIIATKQPRSYDLSMQHLADLRDLAASQRSETDFAKRVAALREAHARKATFVARLLKQGM